MAIHRSSDGRFLEGHCPNPKGRPPTELDNTAIPSPAWRTILDVANELVPVEIRGRQRRTRMTRFEASLWQLGSGNPSNRSALVAFINLVRTSARMQWQLDHPPKRYPNSDEDFAEFEAAAASGSYDQWVVAFDRFAARLPGDEEMTDKELAATIELVRAGKTIKWPEVLETRISGLIDRLNRRQ